MYCFKYNKIIYLKSGQYLTITIMYAYHASTKNLHEFETESSITIHIDLYFLIIVCEWSQITTLRTCILEAKLDKIKF